MKDDEFDKEMLQMFKQGKVFMRIVAVLLTLFFSFLLFAVGVGTYLLWTEVLFK